MEQAVESDGDGDGESERLQVSVLVPPRVCGGGIQPLLGPSPAPSSQPLGDHLRDRPTGLCYPPWCPTTVASASPQRRK